VDSTIFVLVLLANLGFIVLFVGVASYLMESLSSSTFYWYPLILIVVGSAITWTAIYVAPFKFVLTST
jgi:hypothetical protein